MAIDGASVQGGMSQRIDKWLVYARFAKHRAKAADLVETGCVRINRERALKTSQTVKPNDILTLAVGGRIRVVRVLGEADRRGPASAASLLFEELIGDEVSSVSPSPSAGLY
jgi:ribosome-associated heat shock protein Hsp15